MQELDALKLLLRHKLTFDLFTFFYNFEQTNGCLNLTILSIKNQI